MTLTENSILNEITLVDFKRDRSSRFIQTFHFTFMYRGKQYILHHKFEYHGKGVRHWFRFTKPLFFLPLPKPLKLSDRELESVSDGLMKQVNERKKLPLIEK